MADVVSFESDGGISEKLGSLQQTLGDYAGYRQPEERRITDETVRASLAGTLGELLAHLQSLLDHLIAQREEGLARRLNEAETQIEFLYDKMHLAPYAVAPFFTAPRVPAYIVDSMLSHDSELVALTRRVAEILEPTLNESTDFHPVVTSVCDIVNDLSAEIDARISTITEFYA